MIHIWARRKKSIIKVDLKFHDRAGVGWLKDFQIKIGILFPTCFERLATFKNQSLSIDAVIKSGPLRIGAHSIILVMGRNCIRVELSLSSVSMRKNLAI